MPLYEGKSNQVELFLGPYRCGKTSLLIAQLLDFKKEDQLAAVLILVPSARYARILKERIGLQLRNLATGETSDQANLSGIFGLEIQEFYQFSLKVLSKAGNVPRIIPEEIRPAFMTRLLAEMKAQGKLVSLGKIAEFQGTSVSLLELIDEFQRAGLSPAELISRLEASSCQESQLLELAHVYERYWQSLKELDYFDQKSLALKAREELFSHKRTEYDLVIIDGFDRVSHLQAQVFAALSQHSRATKIAFDYSLVDESASNDIATYKYNTIINSASFQYTQPKLSAAAISALSASDVSAKELEHASALRQSSADYRWKEGSYVELLENLQPKVLHFSPSIVEPGEESSNELQLKNVSEERVILPRIEAVSLLDPFMEMVEISRQIKSAIIKRHVSPADLIVVTRSPEAYNGAIEAAFEDAGVSYFIDGSCKVNDLKPWQFIRNFFSLANNEFKRKDFVDLLRSPFMNLEALALTSRDVSLIDRASYDAKLIGSAGSWQLFLSKEEYLSFSSQVMAFLANFDAEDAQASARSHAHRIEDLLEKYMKLPGSDSDLRAALASSERETLKALRRCLKVLIQQEYLFCPEPESFSQFWKRLQSLMEKASYARPRPQAPSVTICSAELVPNRLFKEIYICGVVEGDFPKHQISKGLLSQDQIRLWLSFGIDIRNPRQEPGFERALFYSLTERAIERIFLSLPQFNSKAEETLVSFYIDELSEKTALTCQRISPFAGSKFQPVSVREALSQALWREGLAGAAKLALSQELISKRWQEIEQSLSALLARAKGQAENLFNGYLCDFFESQALSLPVQNVWTASKINDYGKCPFRFWATHVLSLKPREEAEAGLNYALLGQFYHKVLEFFFSAFAESQGLIQRNHENTSKGIARSVVADLANSPEQASSSEQASSLDQRISTDQTSYTDLSDSTGTRANLIMVSANENQAQGDGAYPRAGGSTTLFEAAFAKGIAWIERRADFQAGPYWQQEKKELRFRIKRFIDRELLRIENGVPAYRPVLFEVNFGTNSSDSFPALMLQSNEGKDIFVRGSIDRVDIASDDEQSRIIDYKSGSRTISTKEAERGRNLQLPIYALALEQCIRPGSLVSEADYLSISVARKVGHMNFQAEKQAHLKSLARQFVQDYNAAANRGIFTVKPNGKEVCKDCLQATACRISELGIPITEETDASTD